MEDIKLQKLNLKNEKPATIFFKNKPIISSSFSITGPKEGKGNYSDFIDLVLKDDMFQEKTFEKAEYKMLSEAIRRTIGTNTPDLIIAGDLLNQTIAANFAARDFDIPFIGVYGACSMMAESMLVGASLVDSGQIKSVVCGASSHFASAERQYRFPLELGSQRTPTSQWTVTGAGCVMIEQNTLIKNIVEKVKNTAKVKDKSICITSATFGKVLDYGIMDVNNMGAAMAPAAASTIRQHFMDTKQTSGDYDLIVTGDLGKHGSELMHEILELEGIKIGNHFDCGANIYLNNQDVKQGGSGAGCSAVVLTSYLLKKMRKGEIKKILFVATGALLSPTSSFQGESIPSIATAVSIEVI